MSESEALARRKRPAKAILIGGSALLAGAWGPIDITNPGKFPKNPKK